MVNGSPPPDATPAQEAYARFLREVTAAFDRLEPHVPGLDKDSVVGVAFLRRRLKRMSRAPRGT